MNERAGFVVVVVVSVVVMGVVCLLFEVWWFLLLLSWSEFVVDRIRSRYRYGKKIKSDTKKSVVLANPLTATDTFRRHCDVFGRKHLCPRSADVPTSRRPGR